MVGFQNGLVRYYQLTKKNHESTDFRSIFIFAVATVLVTSSLLSGSLFLFSEKIADQYNNGYLNSIIKSLGLAIPLLVCSDLLSFVFRAGGKHLTETLIRVVIPPLIIVVTFSLAFLMNATLDSLFNFFVCSWLILLLTSAVLILKSKTLEQALNLKLKNGQKYSFTFPKEFVKFSLPLAFMPIANRLNIEFYVLLAGITSGAANIIVFSLAMRLAAQISILPKAINSVVQRKIATAYANQRNDYLEQLYESVTRITQCLTTPIIIVFFWYMPEILQFVGIDSWDGKVITLIILLANYLHVSMGINGMMITMGGWSALDFKITILEIVGTLLVGLLMVKAIGMIGLALSYFLIKFGVNLTRTFLVYRLTGLHPFSNRYLLAASASVGFIFLSLVKEEIGIVESATLLHLVLLLVANLLFCYRFGLNSDERTVLAQLTRKAKKAR